MKPGENLYRIGLKYGVPSDVLARTNRISDVTEIAVGQRIYIPRRGTAGRGSTPKARTSAMLRSWSPCGLSLTITTGS